MEIEIRREDERALAAYASVPTGFDVHEVVDVPQLRVGEALLPTRAIAPVRRKDYDAIADNDPLSWPARFDVHSWIILVAYSGNEPIGGAIVVPDPREVAPPGARPADAVLWDVRIAPAFRRSGIGRRLMVASEVSAETAGRNGMVVETQDTNVPACRLYAACGYVLTAVEPDAYKDVAGEARLVWVKAFAETGAVP